MAANHINSKEYQALLAQDKPVLVDFWAPWCKYCVKISDAYDSLAQKYGDAIHVVKVNIDENEALAVQEKIELIPTLILYQNGREADRIVAPESKAQIEAFLGAAMPGKAEEQQYHIHDLAVIGGGPAGYTAALYAARAGMDAVVLEKLAAGGQMALTHHIDNYPGFENGVDGFELLVAFVEFGNFHLLRRECRDDFLTEQ